MLVHVPKMLFLILVLTRWPFPDCRYFLRKMFRRKQVLGPGGFEHISDTEFLRERSDIELGSGYDGVDDDKDVDDLFVWIVTGGTRHPKCVSIVSILDEVLALSSPQEISLIPTSAGTCSGEILGESWFSEYFGWGNSSSSFWWLRRGIAWWEHDSKLGHRNYGWVTVINHWLFFGF